MERQCENLRLKFSRNASLAMQQGTAHTRGVTLAPEVRETHNSGENEQSFTSRKSNTHSERGTTSKSCSPLSSEPFSLRGRIHSYKSECKPPNLPTFPSRFGPYLPRSSLLSPWDELLEKSGIMVEIQGKERLFGECLRMQERVTESK